MSPSILIVVVFALIVGRFAWFRLRAGRARRLVASGASFVDVRTPGEYASGHLPNARNLPLDVLTASPERVGPKERPVVLYCASGTRSAVAAAKLRRAGYTNVVNLGPMFAWGRK